jgi:hypothetical protein
MVGKGAAAQTWPHVSEIHVDDARTLLSPYDTIFQHTNSSLRAVSLSSAHDYPMILRHLRDRCPRLRSLSLSTTLLTTFPSMARRVADLLPRLLRCVLADDASPQFIPDEVYSIFDMCTSPLNIMELFLLQPTFHELDRFEKLFHKLPHLRRLTATVPAYMLHRVPQLAYLEYLDAIEFSHPFKDEAAALGFLRPLAGSNVANLTFSIESLRFSLVGFLIFSSWEHRALDILVSARITSKISLRDVRSLLFMFCSDSERFDCFVRLIDSNSHPLLPTREEVSTVVVDIFRDSASRLSESSIELLVTTFGSFRPAPSSIAFLLVDLPRRMLVFELGLVTADELAHPKCEKDNLFFFANSPEVLEWLLTSMSKDDALRLLRQRPTDVFRNRCPLMRLFLDPKLFGIVQEKLEGLPIFSFPDPAEFLLAFRSLPSLDSLKLIVDSTGFQNISGETRGRLLWQICASECVAEGAFDYWLDVLESPMFVDDPHFYVSNFVDALRTAPSSLSQARRLHIVFRRYEIALIGQASHIPFGDVKLTKIVSALADWIIPKPASIQFAAGKTDPMLSFSNSDLDFVIERIFTPICRISSDRNELPSSEMAALIRDVPGRGEVAPVLTQLFDICIALDLRDGDGVDRSESRLGLINFLMLTTVAPKLTNLEHLIQQLVHKGCRFSNLNRLGDFATLQASKEALELYSEAVRLERPQI